MSPLKLAAWVLALAAIYGTLLQIALRELLKTAQGAERTGKSADGLHDEIDMSFGEVRQRETTRDFPLNLRHIREAGL